MANLAPKSRTVQRADIVYFAEGNMCVYRYGEISHSTAVLERQSCYTMTLRQLRENLCPPPSSIRGRYANQRKECSKRDEGSRIAR